MTYFSSITPASRTMPADWPPLKLYLRESGRQSFPVSDLVYMQAVANYSWLNWMDGKRMLMPRTLKYYTPKLPSDWFIRLHRNCVVNRRYIDRLERTDAGGVVHLTTGDKLPVSRRRWSTVRRQLVSMMPHLN
ncbi:LytR/AlgR family response regulator transcription factor [Spirosoma rhododendri]|uniref:LytTR family transcriptional regulator n=1 Tax=Spirosoma rhododendri TaxID=2728024 RepID=A0A7L5DT92_9BACT|nr:LytTR family DNA-binding domain-containing protein [Spirosoma rhododendri]QJD80503.1 LytTR family transcriptional regulator [Spirosoma rhododendri]